MKNLTPLKDYTPPQIPTLETATPALLKKIPRRWRKNAAVAACAGIAALSIAAPIEARFAAPYPAPRAVEADTRIGAAQAAYEAARARLETAEMELRTHWGGSGAGPFYVVYFTEQDAFGFIRAKIEADGFDFSADVPDYSVTVSGRAERFFRSYSVNVGLFLYDAQRRVGITRNWGNCEQRMAERAEWLEKGHELEMEPYYINAEDVTAEFTRKGIPVGVIRNPGEMVFDGLEHRFDFNEWVEQNISGGVNYWDWRRNLPDREYERVRNQFDIETGKAETIARQTDEARATLMENLETQAQNIIEHFRAEENAEPSDSEITVTLNGTPLDFDIPPQIMYGRTLVPVRVIFEALGFEVTWDGGWIHARHELYVIMLNVGESYMETIDFRISDAPRRQIELDVPPQIVRGRTLVPIRAIAEATGARVEWNAATQTVQITT